MKINNQWIWITGASSGIGEALARQLAAKGAKLILSARRVERLDALATTLKTECLILPIDLLKAESIQNAIDSINKKNIIVQTLINNAGMSQRGLAQDTILDVDRKIMELNYFGTIALTKKLLPQMIEQNSGQFVVISSLVGKFGFHLRSAYAASKHALHGFFESLALECQEHNIKVLMVCPGRIRTEISIASLSADGSIHGKMDPGQTKGYAVEDCAKDIIKAMEKGKHEVYVGGYDQYIIYIKRFFPSIFRQIAQRLKPT
ncbi:UNVERIFIED_CONTAM: hypothetical protein GTU68_012885 [Idotea baltica]|nr:hypothetical protein [Idotea baltica]